LAATFLGATVGCLIGNWYTENYPDVADAHGAHGHAAAAEHTEGQHGEADQHAAGDATLHSAAAAADTESGAAEPGEAASDMAATSPTEFTETAPEFGGEGPKFPGVFFSIYYAMTGVHAIHILAGIGVFVWIISRAGRGHFEPDYYGPVEYTGLYWHLVDLIWIYLFPLLYLIQ
jgi:cytochrome c oxidase subunit 3